MESETTIQLAVDVLADHFGGVVARVGRVLLERGELDFKDILRFGAQGGGARGFLLTEDEPFGHPSVRNALLVMLQHGVVTHRQPQAKASPDARPHPNAPHLYRVDVEEVLARLRFPHFLEYTFFNYDVKAFHLLNVLLKHGRASTSFAIAEARRAAQNHRQDLPREELDKTLQWMAKEKLIVEIQPCSGGGGATGSRAPADAASAGRGQPPAKRARRSGQRENGAGAENDAELSLVASGSGGAARDSVYRYSRHAYNLCLLKNMVVRLVEERMNQECTAVFEMLVSGVTVSDDGVVNCEYRSFSHVEKRFEDHEDVEDHKGERLRKKLDALHVQSGFVEKRMGQRVVQGVGVDFEYGVQWTSARRELQRIAQTQIVREQFGSQGLRVFNLLNNHTPPQRLEDKEIFSSCMMPDAEGRVLLYKMVTQGIIDTQEIPRSDTSSFKVNFWLYYVEAKRLKLALLEMALQAILNVRVRFRVENVRVAPLENRASSLTARERATLREGRKIEDVLERSALVLDTAVLVFRDR